MCYIIFLFVDNFASIQKQAIPMALVQSGTLGDMHVTKEHKKQDNSSTNTSSLCNENYQNCPPYLIEQAKIDKKIRMNGSVFNVTESAYNASVAGALDNNKTTVIFNKTIHLLQNVSQTKEQVDYQHLDPQPSKSKLIYVAPYKNATYAKENSTENNETNLQYTLPNKTNLTTPTETPVNYELFNDTTDTSNYLKTILNNNTVFNKFTNFFNSTNQNLTENNTNNNLTKRVILTLPHSYYILSSQFDKGIIFVLDNLISCS